MSKPQTPMMRQYLEIKSAHKDEVLFFRLGDFYEMFFDEAVEVSRILNLTLTKRGDVPMCGIPHHASKVYIARLLRAGKKIAICEQTSEPVAGELTERKVVEIITPGTVFEDDFLEQGSNNFLAAIFCSDKKIEKAGTKDFFAGFAYIDITTGDFFATSFSKADFNEQFLKEVGRIKPREILIQQSLAEEFPLFKQMLSEYPEMMQNFYPDWSFNADQAEKRLCSLFGTENLKGFLLNKDSPEVPPAALLIQYLKEVAGREVSHISSIKIYEETEFVSLDDSTRKNLELTNNLRDNTQAYSLFEILNRTRTCMGSRLLYRRINFPVQNRAVIEERLEQVNSLYRNQKLANSICGGLSSISDIERLASRISMQRTNGKELLALKQSLNSVIEIINLPEIKGLNFFILTEEQIALLKELHNFLERAISEDCSISISDGNLIKAGFSKEADALKKMKDNSEEILSNYLLCEREKTGIGNLKIKYNRMLGYFLEVSLGNLDAVPDYFVRQRSISNADRFVTEELKKIEDDINSSEEKLIQIEKELFKEICEKLSSHHNFFITIAEKIAEADLSQALARVAMLNAWTMPHICEDDGMLNIVNGRHPVVESHLPSGEFVPNSILLSSGDSPNGDSEELKSFALITGPNMAGKSTFLRQTALIVLLAQIGSFVPAEKAEISPVDKIFCRVGASDNLARGESTFLVEMIETAYILNAATKNSLVIMDEVGRGTSTEDGLAIAQAVSEYLLNSIGAKTLFATHYHELASLDHKKLINLKLSVLEADGKIVFLKKVEPGTAGGSYGIHVAGLAGLPKQVLKRAENLLYIYLQKNAQLAGNTHESLSLENFQPKENLNLEKNISLFSEEEMVINEILSLNGDDTTPLEALNKIMKWKDALKGFSH